MLQRASTASPSSVFEVMIGVCAALYGACTALTTATMGQLNLGSLTAESLFSGPMLFFFLLQGVYAVVWLVFVAVWLAWYAALLDWARARGAAVPSTLVAIGLWFVPPINCVHPLVTLLTVRKHTGVRTPLGWWWALFLGSLVLSTFAGWGGMKGEVSPLLVVGTVAEVVAALLCWKVVRDFTRADRAWDPRGAIALRDGVESDQRAAVVA